MNQADDFYIGYLDRAPHGVGRFQRLRVAAVIVLALTVSGALMATQRSFSRAQFEFGEVREFTGIVAETPIPSLLIERPGGGRSRYLLATFGKFGAADAVAGLAGREVRLQGTLVYRDDQTMIEIADGSIEAIPGSEPQVPSTGEALGEQTLRGEIVDSKCYLGVMKPGNLKPHRACAVRCISGGIPPVLLVRDEDGRATYLLLVGAEGEAINAEVLEFVAEPVEISGEVIRYDNHLILRADPGTIRRID